MRGRVWRVERCGRKCYDLSELRFSRRATQSRNEENLPQPRTGTRKRIARLNPEILIFDVDGVLVDVRDTYWRSALETIRHLTGRRVSHAELHRWKGLPGNNDDWQMVASWATALGRPTSYEQAKKAFGRFYWGVGGQGGNVRREKIIVTPGQITRWAAQYELNIFTGRNRREYEYTFAHWPGTKHFKMVVTMDDVAKIKPHPEGLYKILGQRDPARALYLGDNIDDALAARDAGVPFAAIIATGEHNYRKRAASFRELGAVALLPRAAHVNKLLQ